MGHFSWIYDFKPILHLILGHLVAIVQKFPSPAQPGAYLGCRNFYDIAEISGYPYPDQNSKHISHSSFFRIWSGYGPMGGPPPPVVPHPLSPFRSASYIYMMQIWKVTMGVALPVGGGPPWGHIQTIYGKMMNVKYVWNFDPDMDIQKFLRYRRNFCTPNMPLAGLDLGISVQ